MTKKEFKETIDFIYVNNITLTRILELMSHRETVIKEVLDEIFYKYAHYTDENNNHVATSLKKFAKDKYNIKL